MRAPCTATATRFVYDRGGFARDLYLLEVVRDGAFGPRSSSCRQGQVMMHKGQDCFISTLAQSAV
jgi:hypothetical protein